MPTPKTVDEIAREAADKICRNATMGITYPAILSAVRESLLAYGESVKAQCLAIANQYSDHPVGGAEQNDQEAFDLGMNYTTGGCDNGSAIADAIRSLPIDAPAKAGGS